MSPIFLFGFLCSHLYGIAHLPLALRVSHSLSMKSPTLVSFGVQASTSSQRGAIFKCGGTSVIEVSSSRLVFIFPYQVVGWGKRSATTLLCFVKAPYPAAPLINEEPQAGSQADYRAAAPSPASVHISEGILLELQAGPTSAQLLQRSLKCKLRLAEHAYP